MLHFNNFPSAVVSQKSSSSKDRVDMWVWTDGSTAPLVGRRRLHDGIMLKSNKLPTAAGDAGMAALLGFALVALVALVRPGARPLSVVQPAAVAAAGAVTGADQRAGSRGQLHLQQ